MFVIKESACTCGTSRDSIDDLCVRVWSAVGLISAPPPAIEGGADISSQSFIGYGDVLGAFAQLIGHSLNFAVMM